MKPEQAAGAVFYTLFCAQMLIYGAVFFTLMWKGVQPIKARSKVLLVAEYFGLLGFVSRFALPIIGVDNCTVAFSTGFMLSYVLLDSLFVRVLRLLLIYNLNRIRLLEKIEAKWYTNPKIVSEFSISLMFGAILIFFIGYRIFSVTYQIYHLNMPSSQACGSPTSAFPTAVMALLVIGLAFLAWKLRKAHDAYWIKSEFFLLMFIAIVAIPAFVVASFVKSTVGNWLILFVGYAIAIVSYGIPSFLGIKEVQDSSMSSSMESSTGTQLSQTSKEIEEGEDRKCFQGYKLAAEWIADPLAVKYIERFIVHYQDRESGDNLLLWFQINEYLKLSDEFLTAKASLLYQKFIKPGAYRYVAFVKEEQRKKIETELEEGMQENATQPVSRHIFDEVNEEVEALLIQKVFKEFKHSQFYIEYKEAALLTSNF